MPTSERVLHGGHFYGGHIAFAMDSMKNTVANIADLFDRQMALLVDARYNNGLPANLSGANGPRAAINHGLKAIADQRLCLDRGSAQADHAGVGVLPLHRMPQPGQGQHGHDRGARCLRVLELTEQVAAALLITVRQGVWLRCRSRAQPCCKPPLTSMMGALAADIAVIEEDRKLEADLRLLLERIAGRAWKLYE